MTRSAAPTSMNSYALSRSAAHQAQPGAASALKRLVPLMRGGHGIVVARRRIDGLQAYPLLAFEEKPSDARARELHLL